MSTHYLNAAFSSLIKPSATKFVLVALADYANELGESYPSIETLENKTCQDRKTIMQSISRLIDAGCLSDTGERKGRTKQIPVYRINIEELKNLAISEQSQKRNSPKNGTVPKTEQSRFSDETVPFFPKKGGKEYQKRYTEPSVYNHQIEPSVLGDATDKQSPKKELTKLTDEWVEENTEAMKRVYFEKMRESELKATAQRWDYIKSDFVEHWINSATNADKFKKKDWLGTWKNQVQKQINFNKIKWKSEESGRNMTVTGKSNLGSLKDEDYLKDIDWNRVFEGKG